MKFARHRRLRSSSVAVKLSGNPPLSHSRLHSNGRILAKCPLAGFGTHLSPAGPAMQPCTH